MLLKLLEGGLDYPESKLGGLGICLLLAPPANDVLLYIKHFSIILETVYIFFFDSRESVQGRFKNYKSSARMNIISY